MPQQPTNPSHLKRQEAAFLVIALILLLVISAMGLASLAQTTTAMRVSQNYSQYMQAVMKAESIAQYTKRILETFPDGQYPGPPTCDSATTSGTSCTSLPCPCNSVDPSFPYAGRPFLAWASGLSSATLFGSSESDNWWSSNGFAYAGAFAGSGNARVVVSLLGANTSSPYQNTYRIVGYATDASGTVKSTYQMFHVWNAYPPDPGNGACAQVTDACNYAQCCSASVTCGYDQSSCESGSATYVPPGWTCTDYFVNGLGYNSSACNNQIAPP